MTDHYAHAERIAIRIDSGMTEQEAIKLTDKELNPRTKPDGREYGKQQLAEAFRILGRRE